MSPLRLGFRVCDRRYPFLRTKPGQAAALQAVLGTTSDAQRARLNLVDQLKRQGAQGLLAASVALHQSHDTLPCTQVIADGEQAATLAIPAHVILLWYEAEQLPGGSAIQPCIGWPAAGCPERMGPT